MAKGKGQNICIRLHRSEPERWTEILRRARQHDPHADKSEVARALFRFFPYDEKLLSEEDRQYFLTEAGGDAQADFAGRA